ncbi:hypothetical protein BCR33DRAFT_788868 [Rhizoclosmatium globosum]|uniref:Uncharacterized protein n=1 Tax=Rhizoclosmatium globosum TaxID=329046 RepID=A0A1Y2BV40_9FUNG|nr:hypothetical protein BCR33DRAFT_788868 [Rhizoclosmatium globosum]|eukprot:ORY38648.1 hypothetical protein BCR33DRAFT_788868 [Rhizoclosmatium globosum]
MAKTPKAKPSSGTGSKNATANKSVAKASSKPTSSLAKNLTKTKTKTKMQNASLTDQLDSSLPHILSLASKLKPVKAAASFGVLSKPRRPAKPTKDQAERLKTDADLDEALGKLGSL